MIVNCLNCRLEFDVKEKEDWFQCPECGLIKIDGDPDLSIYNEEYSNRFDDVLSSDNGRLMSRFRADLIDYFIRKDCRIQDSLGGEFVLDIGCGAGDVLEHLNCFGYYTRGCEINDKYKKFLKSHQDYIYFGSFEKFFKINREKYLGISMFDVLEHMKDPTDTIKKVNLMMSKKGKLIISLPDVNSWEVSKLNLYKHYKPGEHIYLFGKDSLERMLAYGGFEVQHVCYFEDGFRHYPEVKHNIKTVVAQKVL